MARKQKNHFPVGLRYIVLFLILLALLLAAVGTVAWMRHMRSLQTVTLVQVSDLSLVGPTPDTAAIDLGDIDASDSNRTCEYVFGVNSVNNDRCIIQFAHTTNNKFKYEIFYANKDENPPSTDVVNVAGHTFAYGDTLTTPTNSYKNGTTVANRSDSYYDATYQTTDKVQENAVPLYWQGEANITTNGTSYFILKVTWEENEVTNNKETDMVYLTVGTVTDAPGGGA